MAIHRYYDDPHIEGIWQKILRRNRDAAKIAGKVTGHTIAVGNPGFGKTSGNKRRIELHWEQNNKIICLYDAGRGDLAHLMFPSESAFWKVPKVFNGKIVGARGYPVELLYPVTKDLPDRVPNCAKIFTIPVCDLNDSDISAMSGVDVNESVRGIMNYMREKINDGTTAVDYVNIMSRAIKKVESVDGIKLSHHGTKNLKWDVLQPLMNEGLLSSKKVKTALDLRGILKDRHTISVLMLNHCPQRLWGFLVNYFLNHSFRILAGIDGEKKLNQDTFFVMNEIADLLRDGNGFGDSAFAIKEEMGKIFKQSRTAGVKLLADTQILAELPAVKDTVQRIYMYNSSRSNIDKVCEIMGYSTRTGGITGDDVIMIPHLMRGWYYLFDREAGVSVHKQVWTRSRTYEEGDDFEAIYDKKFGKMAYYDKKDFTSEVIKEHEDSLKAWELRKAYETGGDIVKHKPNSTVESPTIASNKALELPSSANGSEIIDTISKLADKLVEITPKTVSKPDIPDSHADGITEMPIAEAKEEPKKEEVIAVKRKKADKPSKAAEKKVELTPGEFTPEPFDDSDINFDVAKTMDYI